MGIAKKMNDIEKMLKDILEKYDLSKPEGREAAFEECVDFAETRLSRDLRCNTFVRLAAQMLEKDPVEFDVIRDMVEMPEGSLIDIAYDDRHGFILTLNPEGIEYLTELLKLLADAPQGEHIHLFNDEEPLTPISFNAVIFHEGAEWFRKAELEAAEDIGRPNAPRRSIRPEEIFAIQIVGPIPEEIGLNRDVIYRVEDLTTNIPDDEDDDETPWRKSFSGDQSRYILVLLSDSYGEDVPIVLHLDDPDVIYFRKEDFDHLID